MGVLKVRSGGAWVNVGVGGGPLPPGGVLGDILVKNSATLSDALWGTSMPKLTLSSGTGQFPTTLTIADPQHATSRRAFIKLGTGWEVGQDFPGTGTKDFYVFSVAGNIVSMSMSADGKQIGIGENAGSVLRLGHGTDARVIIGNDAGFRDVGAVDTIGLVSESDATRGRLRLGSTALIIGGPTHYQLATVGGGAGYYDADTQYFRTAAAATMMQLNTTELLVATAYGKVRLNGPGGPYIGTTDGVTLHLHGNSNTLVDGDQIYFRQVGGAETGRLAIDGFHMPAAAWYRSYGTNGLYFAGTGAGVHSTEAGYVHAYNNSGFKANGAGGQQAGYFEKYDYYSANCNWPQTQVRIANDNGGLGGSSYCGISMNPASSGIAPILAVLGSAGGERFAVTNSAGSGFAPIAASAFVVASSLRYKEQVRELDDEETIAKIKHLRGIHFHDRIHPLNVRYCQRFNDINERWQKHGHKPLVAKTHHVRPSANHDCDVDPCQGSSLHPCNVAMSFAIGRYGLAAEAIYDVLPEMVELDEDRQPQMLNVDQVAALALAAVAALSRKVEQLERKVA